MTRIDVKGAVQLNLPESSNITIFAVGGVGHSLEGLGSRDPLKPGIIASEVILAAIQDFLRFGSEDADNEGKVTRLTSAAVASGASYEDIFRNVGQTALETGLEGTRIGKPTLKLAAAHVYLMGAIEEAMTTPAPQQKRAS